ncbi:hypothetical protein LIT38_04560 [Bacillus sp. CMF12]|uniref:hypothetical protein n=1 Tax=Bacillaceae TaxID=186817 RepID=UPI001FB46759|nr:MULTISPECIES: hypothetical protein [Bacillaceae]UOE56252.1 hypothetical protein IRB79_05725 [Cytobacillus oceanisediminis]USK50739.1 hypothetical protein LIT38_04560 [Bacillus sp. CMF12]
MLIRAFFAGTFFMLIRAFFTGTVRFKIAGAFLAAVMFMFVLLFAADFLLVIIFFNTILAHGIHSFLLLIYVEKNRRREPLSIVLEISAKAPSVFEGAELC